MFRRYRRRVVIADDLVDEMCLTISPALGATAETDCPGAHTLTTPVRLALGHVVTVKDYAYRRYVRPGHDASG